MNRPEVPGSGFRVPDGIGIVGTGRVARALGRLLVDAGEPVVAVAGRTAAHTHAAASFVGRSVGAVTIPDLPAVAGRILIAISDDAIEDAAAELAAAGAREGVALHTSGAHGPRLLDALAAAGVSCGVLHPLQTVATPERGIAALRGATYGVGGDVQATQWAEQIVAVVGGTALRVPADGFASYHAGAVMASNAVIAAIDAAVALMRVAGVDETAALRAVGPLCVTSARNASEIGPEAALTGPVQRGDVRTIRSHAAALAACPPYVADLYRASARALIAISRRRGLSEASARAIEHTLES
jgi:predicted short-subunit dehydrogenase-like oxidoreductase (DUF2520 family)